MWRPTHPRIHKSIDAEDVDAEEVDHVAAVARSDRLLLLW